MAFSINSLPLQHAVIIAPYFGVWTASVSLAGPLTTGEGATIELGSAQWTGTITSANIDGEITRATIVGGAGKMGDKIAPRQWVGKHPYTDIARAVATAAGEILANAPATDAVDFGYTRIAAGEVLDAISERTGIPWRMDPTGRITFTATGIASTGIVIESDLDGANVHAVEDADAQPFALQAIEHEYINAELHTTVRFWRADRGRQLRATHEGTLASQSGSRVVVDTGATGTFECELWHGIQGVSATLATDSPMLVIQLSAERFIAIGHPDGSSKPSSIAIDATEILLGEAKDQVIRHGDAVITPGGEGVILLKFHKELEDDPDKISRVKA